MAQDQQRRTILAVDDHELVRMGLRQVIVQRFAERFTVADAHSLEQALLFLKHRADDVFLLLLDLNLGDTRGLVGLELLRQLYPHLPIAVVSGTHDPLVRDEVLARGALAYFCKTGDAGDLQGLLDAVDSAAALVSPGPAGAAATPRADTHKPQASMRLSSRQIQVLELLLSGLDNTAIALETGLALGSVKNCVSAIFLAFNVRSRAELTRLFG